MVRPRGRVVSAVDVEERVESVEHLDFAQACQVRVQPKASLGPTEVRGKITGPCGEPAVGVLRCRGCADPALVCDSHRALIFEGPNVTRMSCARSGLGVEVFSFEPLRVNS